MVSGSVTAAAAVTAQSRFVAFPESPAEAISVPDRAYGSGE